MVNMYNLNEMSVKTKLICERGKFFIETGTASGFKKFIKHSAPKITRYMSSIWFDRIVDLINKGDIDNAINLWIQVCREADTIPSHRRNVLIFYISYLVIFLMALYAFLSVL